MINRKDWFVLVLIFALAYFLRVMYLPSGALSFYFDTARDAFTIKDILLGDLKIQGPAASVGGIYHGVLYYYFLILPYLFGRGNPIVAAFYQAFFNSLTVIAVFFLAFLITKNKKIGFLCSLIFAVSYEASQYAAWLSNPSMALFAVPILYLMLIFWIRKGKWYFPVLAGMSLGISVQANMIYVYHAVPAALFILIHQRKMQLKKALLFTGVFLFSVSSMIISQVKFGDWQSVRNLFQRKDIFVEGKGFVSILTTYLNQIGDVVSNNVFPQAGRKVGIYIFLTLLIFSIALIVKNKRKTRSFYVLVVLYMLAHLPVTFFGGGTTPHIAAGIGSAVIILTSTLVAQLYKKNKIIALTLGAIIIISNFVFDIKNNKNGQTLLTIQDQMILRNQLRAIDFTYVESSGEPFSINTLTNPLWVNTTWSYLYNWYGEKKYGYLPNWHGHDQIGLLGNNLTRPSEQTEDYYFIIEPTQGLEAYIIENETSSEEAGYTEIKEEYFGNEMKVIKEHLR